MNPQVNSGSGQRVGVDAIEKSQIVDEPYDLSGHDEHMKATSDQNQREPGYFRDNRPSSPIQRPEGQLIIMMLSAKNGISEAS